MPTSGEIAVRRMPTIETERLRLRPFRIEDAERVRSMAGRREIYEVTQNIPHPYQEGMAEQWIAGHLAQFYGAGGITLAVALKESDTVVGAVGLSAQASHRKSELGYWLGVDYWGRGYMTEAAAALVAYGFETLRYHRILSRHFATNPASGRVMQKIGMTKEGELVDDVLKDEEFQTIVIYGIINPADRARRASP